jgi:CheY-like chemotaxis protein
MESSACQPDLSCRPLILVVDDDVRSARTLRRMLSDDGYEVEVAADGAAAIARLGRSPVPDALVTDYYMPHADGMAVTTYARTRRAAIHVLVVTGYPELVPRQSPEPDEPPEPFVMTKPLDYDKLAAKLHELLSS